MSRPPIDLVVLKSLGVFCMLVSRKMSGIYRFAILLNMSPGPSRETLRWRMAGLSKETAL